MLFHFYLKITNGANIIRFLTNIESILFVLSSNTLFLLIIRDKQSLISYCNTSCLLLFLEPVRLKNYVNLLSIIAIVIVIVPKSLSLFVYQHCRRSCHRWRLVVVSVLLLLAAVSLLVTAPVGFSALSLAAYYCCRRRKRYPYQN